MDIFPSKKALVILSVSVLIITLTLLTNEIELKANDYPAFYIKDEKLEWKLFLYEETLRQGLSYKDFVLLREIAYAESGFNHFNKNGEVLVGKKNNKDIGIFQINSYYHEKKAKELELDIRNPYGNIKYAVLLYKEQGSKPWGWSKKNWYAKYNAWLKRN